MDSVDTSAQSLMKTTREVVCGTGFTWVILGKTKFEEQRALNAVAVQHLCVCVRVCVCGVCVSVKHLCVCVCVCVIHLLIFSF